MFSARQNYFLNDNVFAIIIFLLLLRSVVHDHLSKIPLH